MEGMEEIKKMEEMKKMEEIKKMEERKRDKFSSLEELDEKLNGIIPMDEFVNLLTSSYPLEVRYSTKVSTHLMFDVWYDGDRVKELPLKSTCLERFKHLDYC